MLSYLFYLPASRQDVFAQQLRLLAAREDLNECEAVVVWHGLPGSADLSAFGSHTIDSVRQERYNKSLMVNRAVALARGEVLAILDADRIMPPDYFGKVAKIITPGLAVAPKRMVKLLAPVTDDLIWEMRFAYKRDDRPEALTPFRKHLFSGNTVLFKKDYLAAGGMDEGYWGYGFNDLDFSKSWQKSGFNALWSDAEEIHLHHERLDQYDEEQFHIQNAINAYKFSKKWGEPIPTNFRQDLAPKIIPWS